MNAPRKSREEIINTRNKNNLISFIGAKNLESHEEPILVIKMGPTGSGKGSSIVLQKIQELGIDLTNVFDFNIDKLVETNSEFISKTRKIKNKNNVKKKLFSNNKSNNKNFTRILGESYFNIRSKPRQLLNGKSYYEFFKNLYAQAITQKNNIIVETTGDSPEKIEQFLKGYDLSSYKVYILYVKVNSVDVLLNRVSIRAQAQYNKNGAYRLPNSNFVKSIYKKIDNVYNNNLPEIIEKYERYVKEISAQIVEN
jgi:predicted ABC-type ATPase